MAPFFSVTSSMLAESGANVLMVFRPDDDRINSLDDLHEALIEDGALIGVKWKFRGSKGELTDPRRVVLGISGIVVIQDFDHESTRYAPEPPVAS